jgi:general L-amino acid transport system permease protein
MRHNLFRTWWDGIATIVFGGLLLWLLGAFVKWVFTTAQWEIVRVNLVTFMVGRFPREALWRVEVAVLIGAFAGGLILGMSIRDRAKEGFLDALRTFVERAWPLVLLVALLLVLAASLQALILVAASAAAFLLGRGAGYRLPKRWTTWGIVVALASPFAVVALISGFGGVGWNLWGGLLLTLFLAVAGILLSFPLGVLLALGRRSKLPAARWLSIGYIEVIRGVPLIALLFMGFVMLTLFLPAGMSAPGLVIRGIVVLTIFTAAYVAEIVRGGLQSVPHGQEEASEALGLSPVQTTIYIVLPQALTAVIPALVGQFISLFKDTSLVAIVGLLELLGVAQAITQQPQFRGQGLLMETLLFAALIYWVGSFTMSRESQRLEKRLGVGER